MLRERDGKANNPSTFFQFEPVAEGLLRRLRTVAAAALASGD